MDRIPTPIKRTFVLGLLATCVVTALAVQNGQPTAEQKAALATITANPLRGHVEFLASDALKGRGTPSPELDIAAEYIAAGFRGAGLEPGVDKSYFQMAEYKPANAATGTSVRNVIGILRGSDAKLKDTYVFVTAHYDHLGQRGETADNIYNGANDNASSTAALIEMARAFTSLKTKPRRSIVFMAFWGEERGLRGARHYVTQPVFPLKDTVAMVNMEQIGRTDDDESPQINRFAMTGYSFSTLSKFLLPGAEAMGMKLDSRPPGEQYFMASDNAAFAAAGVPAHTISVSYSFPDYHKVGDHADKLDYANMAKVVQAVGAGVLNLANSDQKPEWDPQNPRVAAYREAAKKLQGG